MGEQGQVHVFALKEAHDAQSPINKYCYLINTKSLCKYPRLLPADNPLGNSMNCLYIGTLDSGMYSMPSSLQKPQDAHTDDKGCKKASWLSCLFLRFLHCRRRGRAGRRGCRCTPSKQIANSNLALAVYGTACTLSLLRISPLQIELRTA